MAVTDDRAAARSDHAGLVRLCRQKDVDAAVALLKAHVTAAASKIGELVIPAAEPAS
jgi:DNA-binding GntR family transcriptional regulator